MSKVFSSQSGIRYLCCLGTRARCIGPLATHCAGLGPCFLLSFYVSVISLMRCLTQPRRSRGSVVLASYAVDDLSYLTLRRQGREAHQAAVCLRGILAWPSLSQVLDLEGKNQ